MNKVLFCVFAFIAYSSASGAEDKRRWITEGPYVVEPSFSFELPLEVLATKLFVEVEVGGSPRRFVFDTGSPSMISAELAAELDLDIIGKTQGTDSHGAIVDTDIAQTDFTFGETTFHKVPIFVADFPKTAQCLFDGVLGSEVLPLCAWQIDLPDSVLRCNSNLKDLDHLKKAKKQTLYNFGYPHAPIMDIRFAKKARSKAMFDTGSPGYLAIAPPDFDGAKQNNAIGKTISGHGSIGGSLGGRAPDEDQLKSELKTLSIGNIPLGRVGALLRESPPSLIGASILEHFVVTLDSKSAFAYFDQYREGPFARRSFGFGLSFEETPTISLVWDHSPAADAGLRVGQQVTAINGQPTDTSCNGIRSAMRSMTQSETIELEWEGGVQTLTRERQILE